MDTAPPKPLLSQALKTDLATLMLDPAEVTARAPPDLVEWHDSIVHESMLTLVVDACFCP
jgi:hypothetical protein